MFFFCCFFLFFFFKSYFRSCFFFSSSFLSVFPDELEITRDKSGANADQGSAL